MCVYVCVCGRECVSVSAAAAELQAKTGAKQPLQMTSSTMRASVCPMRHFASKHLFSKGASALFLARILVENKGSPSFNYYINQ